MKNEFIMKQIPLGVKLQDEICFDNFYAGENPHIISYLKNLIFKKLDKSLYLWGAEGVGKTHLLQAACHFSHQQGLTTCYLPLDKYQQFEPQIFQNLEKTTFICLDNISAIATHKLWEEQLFHFYNRLSLNQNILIIADNLPPQELKIQLNDLKSRLIAITALEVHSLSDDQKIEVLQNRAHARGMEFNQEVGQFLLRRCHRSMKHLFLLLDELDMASLSTQRKITVPFVKMVLGL